MSINPEITYTLMHFLPQMSTKDLDKGDLERRNLAVQEDPGQVELHLETNVHVGAIDRWRPALITVSRP